MPSVDPIIGRVVNNYVVERKLGQGGMGSVYRLRHQRLQNTYAALKVLLGEGALDARMTKRFEQEAQVAAVIGSHRVVKPLDLGAFEDGIPYIIMEYVDGESLENVLAQRGPLPVVEALKMAARIADTMSIAHEKGIIHRDLKPANIMLGRAGSKEDAVKLLDFGVARATGDLKLAETSEAAIIGTLGYMSPEAASGLVVDGRSDVFSLGVILYEMLTGELPFPRPNTQAAIVNVLTLPTPGAAARRPAHLDPIPGAVEALIHRSLEKNPDTRFTMAELHSALVQILVSMHGFMAEGIGTKMSLFTPRAVDPSSTPTLSDSAGQVGVLVDRHARRDSLSQPTRTMAAQGHSAQPEQPNHRRRLRYVLAISAILGSVVMVIAVASRTLLSASTPPRQLQDMSSMTTQVATGAPSDSSRDAGVVSLDTSAKLATPKTEVRSSSPKSAKRGGRSQPKRASPPQTGGGDELERPAGI